MVTGLLLLVLYSTMHPREEQRQFYSLFSFLFLPFSLKQSANWSIQRLKIMRSYSLLPEGHNHHFLESLSLTKVLLLWWLLLPFALVFTVWQCVKRFKKKKNHPKIHPFSHLPKGRFRSPLPLLPLFYGQLLKEENGVLPSIITHLSWKKTTSGWQNLSTFILTPASDICCCRPSFFQGTGT